MPSATPEQARFMALCASLKGRKKARGKCPPLDVAREYKHADRVAGMLKGKRKS